MLVGSFEENPLKIQGYLCGPPAVVRVMAVTEALRIMQGGEDRDDVKVRARGLSDQLRPEGGHPGPMGRSV